MTSSRKQIATLYVYTRTGMGTDKSFFDFYLPSLYFRPLYTDCMINMAKYYIIYEQYNNDFHGASIEFIASRLFDYYLHVISPIPTNYTTTLKNVM